MSVKSNTHTPVNYSLDLSINHKTHNFTGVVTIDVIKSAQTSPESEDFEITLNASELIVTSAFVNEVKATVSVNRVEELITLKIVGSSSLYKEDSLKLKINYIGKINQIKTFTDFTKGLFKTNYLDDKTNTSSNYILATHAQLSFARCIYPCVDEPSVKAQFELTIKCFNPEFKVLSCTPIESQTVDGETLTVKFLQTPPMATSIFGFVLGNFEYLETKIKLQKTEVPLRFFTPVGQVSQSVYAFDIASATLPFIESQLNHPYPLQKLDFVALPFLSDGAMENFGLVTIQSTHVLVEKLNNPAQLQQIRQLIVHEIIHHWIGNYVSFNSWEDLWFNESFATWFAYYILYKLKFDDMDQFIWEFEINSSEKLFSGSDNHAIVAEGAQEKIYKRTQDAFDARNYEKGLQLLKMIANVVEGANFDYDLSSKFIPLLTKFLQKNEFKGISTDDLWRFLDLEITDFKFAEFVKSWLTSQGLPLLQVQTEGDVLKLSQVKFGTLQQSDFHIPLLVRDTTGTISNKIMDGPDFEIPLKDFVKFNAENIGVYKVQYRNLKAVEQVLANYGQLSQFDKFNLVNDLTSFVGSQLYHNDAQIEFLYKLSQVVFEKDGDDFELLNDIIPILEKFNNLLRLASVEKFTKSNDFLTSQTLKIFQKLNLEESLTAKSEPELNLLNLVLSINHNDTTVQAFASKIFKLLFQGGEFNIPTLILPSVFQIVSAISPLNQWKKILELIKNPVSVTHHIAGEAVEVQTAAVKAIGYNLQPEMIKRTFNFVLNNFDMNLIELGLIGLTHNFHENQTALSQFLIVNFMQLYKKSIVKNSNLSEVYGKNLKGLVCLIFNGLVFVKGGEDEISKIMNKFKDVKLLGDCLDDVREFNKGNVKIVESLGPVVDKLL